MKLDPPTHWHTLSPMHPPRHPPNPSLLEVPIMGRNQCGCITGQDGPVKRCTKPLSLRTALNKKTPGPLMAYPHDGGGGFSWTHPATPNAPPPPSGSLSRALEKKSLDAVSCCEYTDRTAAGSSAPTNTQTHKHTNTQTHKHTNTHTHTHTHVRARVGNRETRTKQEKQLKENSSGTAELS